jgi:FlaA1/EpsC-like NDP-sugar epimerase
LECKVDSFVLISTDKAVRPTNTMGSSKRVCELILQAFAQKQSVTNFAMVRFGNVLGSSGSVIPLFSKQIKAGGPITITDKKITRFFMTIPEAVELVIQAGSMSLGGDVFVLDMGKSVKIEDLARKMVRLSGLEIKDESNSKGDIAIQYTGLRAGEKLYEELLIGDNVSQTQHKMIMRAQEESLSWVELEPILLQMQQVILKNDSEDLRVLLKKLVTGFSPQCEVVDLLK